MRSRVTQSEQEEQEQDMQSLGDGAATLGSSLMSLREAEDDADLLSLAGTADTGGVGEGDHDYVETDSASFRSGIGSTPRDRESAAGLDVDLLAHMKRHSSILAIQLMEGIVEESISRAASRASTPFHPAKAFFAEEASSLQS